MTNSSSGQLLDGIRVIIDSSSIPMFFCDQELNVLYCNKHVENLLNIDYSLVGHHVNHGLDLFTRQVPRHRQQEFLSRQEKLITKMTGGGAPHAEDIELVDNRDLIGNPYQGLLEISIHADKVRDGNELLGMFVFYRVRKLNESDGRRLLPNPSQVFVVMKFDDNVLNSAYEGVIKPVAERHGFTVVRMDQVHNSGNITEQMLNAIEESRIVLADLSGERPNCYYETGYAHAVGKELILTIRKTEEVHFNLSVHRFIKWETEAELRKQLNERFASIVEAEKTPK